MNQQANIKEAIQKLNALGHKLVEPARQYCAYCKQPMFTLSGTQPCPSKKECVK